ncbi:MAG: PAS domain S-box protein [Deltaproteobacteria bacterium]|nr:PAS domain S-box protein [Deltaproteobacteria bacterium]
MAAKPSYEELEEKIASLTRENRAMAGMLKGGKAGPLSETFQKNEDGIPVKMTGANDDTGDQKEAEKLLEDSERKWRDVLIHTPQIGISLNRDAGIVFVNEHFLKLTGWKAREVMGRDWFDMFIPEKVRDKVRKVFKTVMAMKETSGFSNFENEIVTKSGELMNVAWSNVLTKDSRGNVVDVTCLGVDLTERQRSEKALRKSESKYRSMMEAIKDPVYICDGDYRVQYMNRSMMERIGRDGTGEYCYKALHDFHEKCPWCLRERIVREGHGTNDIVSPKDNKSFSVSSAVLDSDDGSFSKISVFRDTTEFKKLQNRLQQAQKMESIGNLAGGIAHDFNNLLFPIVGMSELLLEDLPPDGLQYQNVRQILKAGERGRDLIQQIQAFSRRSEIKMVPVRPQQIVEEVLQLSRSGIPTNFQITQFIQGDCGFVMADATQLHQVAMNLITNAYHAVEQNGGGISVQLRERTLVGGDPADYSLKPGQYAMLSVSDTGCGIDPAVMDKIFDPYFTTKEKKKGTGLGLAVVFGIVKEHGGDITVHSELEKGTTFKVYLPLLKTSSETESVKKAQIHPKGTERILLVDDEEDVLRLEKMMLERLGYQVETRNGSIGALGAFGTNPKAFDLVITDMAMPNMTGDQLTEELISIREDIPIIMLSGFSERINAKKINCMGVKGFLMKPVSKSDLAHMVRKTLNEAKEANRAPIIQPA